MTVAIVDAYAAPTIASDATPYAINNGDGAYGAGQFTADRCRGLHARGKCGPSGWYGEETLDVEAVHAMAPGANIHFYGAASCFDNDLLDALAQVVNDDQAQLVTNSWGEPEEGEDVSTIPAYESIFLQGAIEGISFMFSSGDNGDELASTGAKQADYPTSIPYVTSVGGTSTAIGSDGSIIEQTGWGTVKYSLSSNGSELEIRWRSCTASGGGHSALFNKPATRLGREGRLPRRPGRGHRRRPEHGHADRRDADLPGRQVLRPVPHRRHQPRLAAVRGRQALAIQNGGARLGLLNPFIYATPARRSSPTSGRCARTRASFASTS